MSDNAFKAIVIVAIIIGSTVSVVSCNEAEKERYKIQQIKAQQEN